MGVFGDTLRQARAYKGVTLKEAEQATRINRHHLAALEDEHFSVLPPLIYQRGIVRNYATYLELDPGKLLQMFEEAAGGDATVELVAAVKPLEMPSHWAPNFAIIAFMVVMSAIVFAWAYSAYFSAPAGTATLAPSIPTVTPIAESMLALPSPTVQSSAPDPSPTPTPRLIATPEPPTATPEPTTTTAPSPTAPATADQVNQVTTQQQVPQNQPQTEQPTTGLTVSFTATDWIYLSVVVDGVSQVERQFGPGETTGTLYGGSFSVYTSNASATSIVVNGGSPFVMSFDPIELSFPLP
jgi:cytoskeletal protein RodZ